MQVMGSVARELGYLGPLQKLCVEQWGILYGCLQLKRLMHRYTELDDVIASYNAGSPIRVASGRYKNQSYVDAVNAAIARIRASK